MELWALHVDVWITRRKRFYIIVDQHGRRRWFGRLLADALEFLYVEGQRQVLVIGERQTYRMTLERLAPHRT